MQFLRNHRDAIAAMDFFTVPTATFRVLYVWFAIDHAKRRVLDFDVTARPLPHGLSSSCAKRSLMIPPCAI